MIVNNKDIPEEIISKLIQDIKSNKYNIGEDYVSEQLRKHLLNNSKAIDLLISKPQKQLVKTRNYKQIIKEIRNVLRKRIEVFQTSKNISNLLEELKITPSLESHNKLLLTNKSTRERLEIYPALYKKIFDVAGKPRIILDLACGLNPLSFPYMELSSVSYFAVDINQDVVGVVRDYFKIMNVDGRAEQQNIIQIKELPQADVCFLFKALDVLELKKGHKFAEELIKKIPARYVIVSFSTKTLSGKPMNHPQRGWIERLCDRLNYECRMIKEYNEIFYLIKK